MRSFALAVLLLAPAALSQTVQDSSFADGGFALLDTERRSFASAVLPRADGGVYVGGAWSVANQYSALLAFRPDGTLDPEFGTDGVTRLPTGWSMNVHSVVQLDDGRLLLVGIRTSSGLQSIQVVRLFENGTIDDSFGFSGRVTLSVPNAPGAKSLAGVDTDGTYVYVAGDAQLGTAPRQSFVVRVGEDGLDDTFGSAGSTLVPEAASLRGIAVDAQGRSVVVGAAAAAETAGILAWRLDAAGEFDPDFKPPTLRIRASATSPAGVDTFADGRVVLSGVGTETRAGTAAQVTGIWRLSAEGVPDAGFGNDGLVTADVFQPGDASERDQPLAPLALAGNAVGVVVDASSTEGVRWLMLREDGTPDLSNGEDGIARLFPGRFETYTTSAAVAADGFSVVVGGKLLWKTPDTDTFQEDLWVARFSVAPSAGTSSEAGLETGPRLVAAPNPSRGALDVRLTLDGAADLELAVFDMLGRRVATLHDGPAPAGELRAPWDASAMAPGSYLVRARIDGELATRLVTVAR